MNLIYPVLFVTLLFVSCKPKTDSAANEVFEKNSKTVYKKKKNGVFDPETNIKDNEIKAMF